MTARKVTPEGYMQGILHMIDGRTRTPTAELLDKIRTMATDALVVLKEPDPIKQKVSFILLAIQQSTEVKIITVHTKRVTRVKVVDLDLYNWALEEIHKLAGSH